MGFSLNKNLEHSSIFDDIRFALSSRPITIILTLSALFRIAFHFYILPNSPSVFGPDEGTYAALAKYVAEGLPVQEFPSYGAGLYNSAKSITLPSAFLVQLGMAELMAVRTIASVYGLASSLVLVLCFLALIRLRSQTFDKLSPSFDRKFLALLVIFTFFPSNFIWSTIGLRESGSQFWLITTFYLILKLLASTRRDLWKFTGLCSLALALAHGARPETALVFSLIAGLTSIVLIFKFRQFLPLIAILLGVFAGQALTTTPEVLAESSIGAYKIGDPVIAREILPIPLKTQTSAKTQITTPTPVAGNQSAAPTPVAGNQSAAPTPVAGNQGAAPTPVADNQGAAPTPMEALSRTSEPSLSAFCNQDGQLLEIEGEKFRCKEEITYKVVERNVTETVESQILTPQILEYKRNVNTIDAQSALPASDCQGLSRDTLLLIKCNLKELPYRLFAFLFKPLIFLDQGSTTLTLAALENLGWMILVPLSVWVSLRRRENTVDRFISLSLTSYVLLFASAAALYEGNLGTAFRHKSTILWPLIFILMITPGILPKLKRKTKSLS